MTLQAQGCSKLHQTLLQYGGAPTDPLPTSPEHPGPSVSGEAPAQALLPSGCAEPCRTPRGRCPPRRSLAPGHARTASAGDLRGRRDRAGDAGRAAGSPPRPAPTPQHAPTRAGAAIASLVAECSPRPRSPSPYTRGGTAPRPSPRRPPPARGLGILGAAPLTPSRRPPRHPGLFHRAPGPAARAVPVPRSPAAPRDPSSTHRLVPSRLPPPRRPMARRHLA